MTEERTYQEIVAPTADRFRLAGKLGCDTRLDPDAAESAGKLITALAQELDRQNIARWHRRNLRMLAVQVAAFVAVMILAWFFS